MLKAVDVDPCVPLCTPVYPYVLYPCVPLCTRTPVYSTPALCAPVYPCVSLCTVPLCMYTRYEYIVAKFMR
jgi:hypothetical protein